MPKKGKKKVKRKGVKKRKQPTYAVEKPRRIATAGQFKLIHNQELINLNILFYTLGIKLIGKIMICTNKK